MLPREVEEHIHCRVIGRRLYYFPETDSTNDNALSMARAGEREGSVIYTDYQRRGRGRHDHTWQSPRGKDLLFSLVLRPPGEPREVLPVTLVVSIAVLVALDKRLPSIVGVKWPNDVVVSGGKIAGILAQSGTDERGERFVVVGVGVNVNSKRKDLAPEIRDTAESCRIVLGEEVPRAELFGDVLTALESYYDRFTRDGFATFVSTYQERLSLLGRTVRFDRQDVEVTGAVLGVADDGALRVSCEGEEIALYGETVEVVG
jgi:BirA family biotin operon repressor/biotin-[acetyl-CoA-carboxylase] ligase